nr:MAG TPA: 3'5'-cyclic nucleotide phosphodiesterase [Caudoviricetes sp.]
MMVPPFTTSLIFRSILLCIRTGILIFIIPQGFIIP